MIIKILRSDFESNKFLEEIKKDGNVVIKIEMSAGENYRTNIMIVYATKDEVRDLKLSTILDKI